MSSQDIHFLRDHIVRLQSELSSSLGVKLPSDCSILYDERLLNPLLALYDRKMKEKDDLLQQQNEALELIRDEVAALKQEADYAKPSPLSDAQVTQWELKVQALENENNDLTLHLSQAENSLVAASERLDVYRNGLEDVNGQYGKCLDEYQSLSRRTKSILQKRHSFL